MEVCTMKVANIKRVKRIKFILTGGVKPPLTTVPYVQHSGAVAVPEQPAPEDSAAKEGGGAEATVFGGGGGKGGNLKGAQC